MSTRAISSISRVVAPMVQAAFIFSTMGMRTRPACRIISISRRDLRTIGIAEQISKLVLPSFDSLAAPAAGTAEESAVITHQQIRLDALHDIQRHADDDQQTGAAEELGD